MKYSSLGPCRKITQMLAKCIPVFLSLLSSQPVEQGTFSDTFQKFCISLSLSDVWLPFLPLIFSYWLTNAASKCDSLILSLCVSVSLKDNLGNSWMLRKDSGSCRVTLLLTSCLSLPLQWLCCSQMGTVIYAALRCNQVLSLKPSTSAPSWFEPHSPL